MKLKYYLRGTGIGVIVSTLILMIAFGVYQGKTKENTPAETENTSQELTIAEALSELETEAKNSDTETGETETEKPVATTEETEVITVQETNEASEETAGDEDAQDDAKGVSAESEAVENGAERIEPDQNTGEGEETGTGSPNTPVEVKKTVSVVVQGGDSPKVVAEKLVRAGAVDNADRFYDYLLEHGLNDGIEIGNFAIPEDADYETVAKIITTNEYESRVQR